MNKVKLSTIEDDENTDIEVELDDNNLPRIIMDFTFSLETRIKALERYFSIIPDDTIQIVTQLCGMYMFSGTSLLRQYLFRIATDCKIDKMLKLKATKILIDNNRDKELGFDALNCVCEDMYDIPTPCQIEAAFLLMLCDRYVQNALGFFVVITNNQALDCDYRYKTLLSLEYKFEQVFPEYYEFLIEKEEIEMKNKDDDDKEIVKKNINLLQQHQKELKDKQRFITIESYIPFLYNPSNMTLYRILAAQYLFKLKLDEELVNKIENKIISFSEDQELDYNLRADATDLLLNSKNPSIKGRAEETILKLGEEFGTVRTIYDNAQNAHNNEIQASALEIIEHFGTFPLMKMGKLFIDFEFVKAQLVKILKDNKEDALKDYLDKNEKESISKKLDDYQKKIMIALNRILLDRTLYSNYNYTLEHILLKLWTYINSHESEEELKKRILEELYDLAGICSSGFVDRLANVISGYGEFSIRISWEDQIVSNFVGRLNARARHVTEKTYGEKDVREIIMLFLLGNPVLLRKINDQIVADHEDERKEKEEKLKREVREMEKAQTRRIPRTDVRFEYKPTDEQVCNFFMTGCDMVIEYITEHFEKVSILFDFVLDVYQENILIEMAIPPSSFEKRANFLKFFRDNMLSIREEMYQEFKDYMEDTDYDLYWRKALEKYDGY